MARAVEAASPALAAEVEGTRLSATDVPGAESGIAADQLPDALRRAAERVGAAVARIYPVFLHGRPAATLELYRTGGELSAREELLGRLAAAHVGVAVRLERRGGRRQRRSRGRRFLSRALRRGSGGRGRRDGDGRACRSAGGGGDRRRGGRPLADRDRRAADLPRLVWLRRAPGVPARRWSRPWPPSWTRPRGGVATTAEGGNGLRTATLPLGEPPVGALQLYFEDGGPAAEELELLSPFAARAALALRRSRRVGLIARALQRSQTVIGVVSQAIAQLSLTHTLETAVERIAELTGSGHVAIYLREGERLDHRGLARAAGCRRRPRGAAPRARARAVSRARLRLHRGHAPRLPTARTRDVRGSRPASAVSSSFR